MHKPVERIVRKLARLSQIFVYRALVKLSDACPQFDDDLFINQVALGFIGKPLNLLEKLFD